MAATISADASATGVVATVPSDLLGTVSLTYGRVIRLEARKKAVSLAPPFLGRLG